MRPAQVESELQVELLTEVTVSKATSSQTEQYIFSLFFKKRMAVSQVLLLLRLVHIEQR